MFLKINHTAVKTMNALFIVIFPYVNVNSNVDLFKQINVPKIENGIQHVHFHDTKYLFSAEEIIVQ